MWVDFRLAVSIEAKSLSLGRYECPTIMNLWSMVVIGYSSLLTMWSHRVRMFTFRFLPTATVTEHHQMSSRLLGVPEILQQTRSNLIRPSRGYSLVPKKHMTRTKPAENNIPMKSAWREIDRQEEGDKRGKKGMLTCSCVLQGYMSIAVACKIPHWWTAWGSVATVEGQTLL